MIPKGEYTSDPAKYRPITCLPTVYKLFTACIASAIYKHCEQNNILAEEQKGCIKGSRGCKEQLLIDAVILGQAKSKRRGLYMSYIDYRKAFDSVPHAWLLHVLEIYKVEPKLISLMKHLMTMWKTTISLSCSGDTVSSAQISIKRGIFQGDSLSPLIFCLALNPLSHMLNNGGYGFKIESGEIVEKVTHLLYMDDLKLYASKEAELRSLLRLVEVFSEDIRMSFGLDKCRTISVKRGIQQSVGFTLEDGQTVDPLNEEETYKYLGVQQALSIEHKTMKQLTTKKFIDRVKTLLKTKLSGRRLCKAINSWAVPTLMYTFGIIHWTKTDLDFLERKIRVNFTKARANHPKSAIERFALDREYGGRGIIDLRQLHRKQIMNLREYFLKKQITSRLHAAVVRADVNLTPVNLGGDISGIQQLGTQEDLKNNWKRKVLHGRHPHDLGQDHVDGKASNYWLTHGDLFPETEGFVIAIQDQVIATKNYLKYIIKDPNVTDDRCRMCGGMSETIQHVISACRVLASTDYTHRHNQMAKVIHQELALHYELISTRVPYYEYTPESVLESSGCKLYWDRSVLTDRTILANRPDIILTIKNSKMTYLIDITIPNTHNLQQAYGEKLNKYLELAEEIRKMWRQDRVLMVPLVMSATGVVPKTLPKNLKELGIFGGGIITTVQKAVLLSTCATVRRFLNLPSTR